MSEPRSDRRVCDRPNSDWAARFSSSRGIS